MAQARSSHIISRLGVPGQIGNLNLAAFDATSTERRPCEFVAMRLCASTSHRGMHLRPQVRFRVSFKPPLSVLASFNESVPLYIGAFANSPE